MGIRIKNVRIRMSGMKNVRIRMNRMLLAGTRDGQDAIRDE
jgi:hypothetical protein